jgi:malonate decarboxylase epsilon subunit
MLQNLPGTALAQAREVLGSEVDTLDSADALSHTRAVQLCLLIAGVAWRASWNVAACAGYRQRAVDRRLSGGGYRRRAGFTDALKLVALRGDLMEQAYPHGYGLTAIMGLTPQVEG